MTLSVRPTAYTVPGYSLTGDMLSYLNCGLQYRYHNRGSLPPSKPVQLWFGQFIHGVMEEAYRTWMSGINTFPWTDDTIRPIIELIIRRLSARNIEFQRFQLLGIAITRAFAAINTWGPELFPLISDAEVRLKAIRVMPAGTDSIRLSDYYEIKGVVDVISSVQLSSASSSNPIVNALLFAMGNQAFDVVVDYKGMRRPSQPNEENQIWEYQGWQVQTYAWLRQQQPSTNPVRTGILLYLNELVPGIEDIDRIWEEVFGNGNSQTDMPPTGNDLQVLRNWGQIKPLWQRQINSWIDNVRDWWRDGRDQGELFPQMPEMPEPLSADFRKARSLRMVQVDQVDIVSSLDNFDRVVSQIEGSVTQEFQGQPLTRVWQPRPRDETCTVCDFRKFCPAPGNRYRGIPTAP